jgi:hypothetical protein
VEVEAVLQPGKDAPAEHYHPIQEEHFLVLEGTLHVRIDGEERDLSACEVLVIPPEYPARDAVRTGCFDLPSAPARPRDRSDAGRQARCCKDDVEDIDVELPRFRGQVTVRRRWSVAAPSFRARPA